MDETQVLPPGWQNGDEAELVPEPGPRSSLLDSLRAKRDAAAAAQTFDLEVPGYDGCLVLRLGPIPGQTLSALAERAQASKSPDKAFNVNADLILRACQEVLGRRAPGAELEPVDPDGTPVRIDARLAELFGIVAASSREVLRELWEAVPSPEVAIGLAAGDYIEWSAEARREVDEGFLGESPTAPR